MNKNNYVNEPQIIDAYERYDADPRANGPDDFDAFKDALMATIGVSARPEDGYTGRFPYVDGALSYEEETR